VLSFARTIIIMLQVSLVSLLCSFKDDVPLKVTIRLIIN
jgi:hypothetical protein